MLQPAAGVLIEDLLGLTVSDEPKEDVMKLARQGRHNVAEK